MESVKQEKTAHTKGFLGYEDVTSAVQKVEDNWDKVSKTDKYSTGLPLLDEYLGGGYGIEGAGEVVLIHSTSKTFKSTFSMQLMKDPLERGVKVGWIILEGGLWRAIRNLKQLYAPHSFATREGGSADYSDYEALAPKLPALVFAMTEEMQQNDFSMDEVISWMGKARVEHGIDLFLIDPIGYLSDYSSDWNTPDYKKESRFMKSLINFADTTASTVVCLQHNIKASEGSLHPSYRESAIGGSQSFSKSPTKVIEMRGEGWLYGDPSAGRCVSLEMYMARDVRDWRLQPVLLDVNFHKDGKGKFFTMHKYAEPEAEEVLKRAHDQRTLWYRQIKGANDPEGESAADLEALKWEAENE